MPQKSAPVVYSPFCVGALALLALASYGLSLSRGMSNLSKQLGNSNNSLTATPVVEVHSDTSPRDGIEIDRDVRVNLGKITITNNGREDIRITSISFTMEKVPVNNGFEYRVILGNP